LTVIRSVTKARPIAQGSVRRCENDCDTTLFNNFAAVAFLELLMAIAVQKRLIARGLLAGAIGGLIAFAVARIIVEVVIGAPSGTAGMGQQGNVGMACAVVVFGAAMGGLLAVAFAVSYRRLSSLRPATVVVLLAADAFAALSVLPSVIYPLSPVLGGGDKTATRTGLYLLLVGLSLALIIGAVWVGRRLAARIGSWNITLVGAGVYGVGFAAAMWLLPPVDQTIKGFPANDVTAVRLSSLAAHLVLWATIATVFAPLASKVVSAPNRQAGVLRLDDYRERPAIPARTRAFNGETPVPPTHGRFQR
jgi:hypothetical protein